MNVHLRDQAMRNALARRRDPLVRAGNGLGSKYYVPLSETVPTRHCFNALFYAMISSSIVICLSVALIALIVAHHV